MTTVLALGAALTIGLYGNEPPRPKPDIVLISIRATKPADMFTPPDYRDRLDSVKDLALWLARLLESRSARKKVAFVQSTSWRPDVVVEILGREADGDIRTVRASVIVGSTTVPMVGSSDDGAWRDAAEDLAKRLRAWLLDNHAAILKSRAQR